jgi:predicted deoxyguanosinetriphosphate triphosphohydrolase
VAHEGDYFRTRLTHSLEVAQIARSLAYALGLDVDLAETVALAHDLGHPPFGHAGEDELRKAMAPYGGFDHNVQTFRIVTRLEKRYPSFDGLNLTWETLEGVVKHNGPVATGWSGRATRRSRSTRRARPGAGDLGVGGGAGGGAGRTTSPTTTTTWTTGSGRGCSAWRTWRRCR